MTTLALGFPCWQSVATPFFESVMDLEIPDGTPRKVIEGNVVADQHERIARWFVEETRSDYLLLLEQDHRFPRNLLARVANYEQAVVGALYYSRMEPYFPVALVPKPEWLNEPRVWEGDWDGIELTPLWPSLEEAYKEPPGLNRVCAVGMGCFAIRRDVLEEWPKGIPYFRDHWEYGKPWSDDVWFCCQARRLGHEVYVDTGVRIPHMGLRDVDERTHRSFLERRAMELGIPVG